MAKYKIEISRSAKKQLKKLPREDQQRVVKAILELAGEPLPRGVRKLAGYDDVFRIRVGRYRIIYSVSSGKLVIIILMIGHRKNFYR